MEDETPRVRQVVTQRDIARGLRQAGLGERDTVFVHSSLASLGYVVNGADAVIDALLETVGPQGTVVMPTFVLEDRVGEFGAWWNKDTTPSTVGRITEVFRQRPGTLRSDHPIHSVAASGPEARAVTRGNGSERLSPWEGSFNTGGPFDHLHSLNARYLLLGVSFLVQTLCHYVEALFVERALRHAAEADSALHQRLRRQVAQAFGGPGVWPGFDRIRMGRRLLEMGLWSVAEIGRTPLYMADTQPYVTAVLEILSAEPEAWFSPAFLAWYAQIPGVALMLPPQTAPAAMLPSVPRRPPDGMVCIAAGPFIQGSTRTDVYANAHEIPQRLVTLDAFYMDRHPVTNAEYAAFVAATGHPAPPHWPDGAMPAGQERHPVTHVDWYDAAQYAAWVGKRLPTEAEWEKAARGGLTLADGTANPQPWRAWPWGDLFDGARLAATDGAMHRPTPVGQFSPAGDSPDGVADMAGNVWEWVSDWYAADYYTHAPEQNPTGPTTGVQKVARGGAVGVRGRYARCAYRCPFPPRRARYDIGFRCAWTPPAA